MVSCKIKSQGACHWSWHWTYSEHTVNVTLNTHWTQSKKLQIAANLCSWWWFSEKNTNIEFSFDFHGFVFPSVFSVFYASFTACSMYVQCTFTVSSLRARGTCRRKYEVCEGRRGKRNSVTGCILVSAFAALSLQPLQRESTLLRVLLVDEILHHFMCTRRLTLVLPL